MLARQYGIIAFRLRYAVCICILKREERLLYGERRRRTKPDSVMEGIQPSAMVLLLAESAIMPR